VRADDAAQAQASQPASRAGIQPVAGFSVSSDIPMHTPIPIGDITTTIIITSIIGGDRLGVVS
jgi:hypothetical protein